MDEKKTKEKLRTQVEWDYYSEYSDRDEETLMCEREAQKWADWDRYSSAKDNWTGRNE